MAEIKVTGGSRTYTPSGNSGSGGVKVEKKIKPIYNNKKNSMDRNYVSVDIMEPLQSNMTTAGGARTGNDTYYPTVVMTGTHGNPTWDAGSQRNGDVVDSNRAFREADAQSVPTSTTNSGSLSDFSVGNSVETVSTPTVDMPVEKVKTDLATFSSKLSKQAKYNKLSKNLTTLYQKTMDDGAERQRRKQNDAAWSAGIFGVLGAIGTAINPIVGGIVAGIGAGVTASIQKDANDTSYTTQAQKYAQLAETFQNYSETLESGDAIIRSTMDSVTGTLQEMRLNYGDAFVDQFYNVMLAKSGIASNDYSLLTGNFKTYNQMAYGQESGEAGLYDELTQGNANLFSNMYAQLTSGDLADIKASLTQALLSGDTALGEQLRGQEMALDVAMENFLTAQEGSIGDAMVSMLGLTSQARQDNIGYAEQLGSAEARRASSGFRGGTATANEALARLYQDMGRIAGSARITNAIRNLRYNMEQQARNASLTAYNYRSSMRQAEMNAENQMIIGFTNIGKTYNEAQLQRNRVITEAQEYERQAREGMDELDADETDIVLDSL